MELIYSWINFGIFAGLLWYFLRRPLRDFLRGRQEGVRQEIQEVSRERLSVETRFKEYRRKLAEADSEIEVLKLELKEEGELEKEGLIRKAREFAEKIREEASQIGEQGLRRSRIHLQQKTLLLAIQTAKEKIQTALDPADQERLVAWGIEKLGEGDHERKSIG